MLVKLDQIPSQPIQVLITDGHTRAGLAVARSLAQHGISFLALCPFPHALLCYSRAARFALLSPDPFSQPEAFMELVLALIRKFQIRLALPLTDRAVVLFERARHELESLTKVAMAGSSSLSSVLDKRANLRLAEQVGIHCPRTFRLENQSQIPEMIRMLGFPVVIKRSSDSIADWAPQFKFKVLYAHDEDQLRFFVEKYCMNGEDPLFQEFATGHVFDLCCFAARGELLAVHAYHAVRRFGGSGVLRKIVESHAELTGHARILLRALRWDGVAHLSFFVDEKRGKTWYMETNARFWASTQGSIHAGWDFPYWTVRYFLDGTLPEPGPIRIGSETCWHTGDLLALLKFLAGEGETPTPGTRPGRLRAVAQFLSDFRLGIHYDLFRWSDPMPAVIEAWPYCKRLLNAFRHHAYTPARARQILFPMSPDKI